MNTKDIKISTLLKLGFGLLALLIVMVSVLLALPRRSLGESATRPAWDTARAEMAGLEHFARISVARGEALERESGARHRAEEDLQLSRTLLGQSLEERIQLGRELHDSICQTLYAVSLTLEGLRTRLAGGPWRHQSTRALTAGSAPSNSPSTEPSGRFLTQPQTPRSRARTTV